MNDAFDVVRGDVLVRDGAIAAVGRVGDVAADRVIDAGGDYVIPGFVQTHVHLCQTLFRSFADDLPLLDWLRRRVWPLEAAHTAATLRASTRLAAAELLLSGTTTALTMETVHDTDVVFEALQSFGLRATVGKCMMDADDQVPARLREETQASIDRINLRADREPLVAAETIQAMGELIMAFMGGQSGHYSLLGQLRQPTLIVSGDDDHFFPVKNQWLLYREIPHAQLAMYPLAGHAPHHQHPAEVAAQVGHFLATA